MDRMTICVWLAMASLLTTYSAGLVRVRWSVADATKAQGNGTPIKVAIASHAASEEADSKLTLWFWAAVY